MFLVSILNALLCRLSTQNQIQGNQTAKRPPRRPFNPLCDLHAIVAWQAWALSCKRLFCHLPFVCLADIPLQGGDLMHVEQPDATVPSRHVRFPVLCSSYVVCGHAMGDPF